MNLDKKVYKYIEYELYNYNTNKKELKELRNEIINGSTTPTDGQPRGNQTGNPTEQKTIKLNTSVAILRLEKIINAIEEVLEIEKDKTVEETIKIKQERGEDIINIKLFLMKYIRKYGIVRICNELHISERTYYNYKDRLIKRLAINLGY